MVVMRVMAAFATIAFACSCAAREVVPTDVGEIPRDARAGIAPSAFDEKLACADWRAAAHGDATALTHASFPELDRAHSCFAEVRYRGEDATPEAALGSCGYSPRAHRAAIEAEANRYERIARGDDVEPPLELACALPTDVRRASAANNARVLRAAADDDRNYAYATIEAFGFGHYSHEGTVLDAWKPTDACPRIDMRRFGVNVDRAARAALAWAGGVAPFVVVSGGAVHSRLVEAFLLDYIATCRIGMPRDRVLVDPCANHTHTNVRNAGRILAATGGRTAYIVTDDALQAAYLQEHTVFDWVGGSIDQRSLRDFHHLLGSWRQASRGMDAGFWYTPYRFWADERLHDLACLR